MLVSYPEELIEEIRVNNDIVELAQEYVKLERKGKNYFGLCPFHKEKTPSFSVDPSKQMFYCFGCGKGGNVIQLVMYIENLDFIEALKLLADRARIRLPESSGSQEVEKLKLKETVLRINKEAAKFYFNILKSEKGKPARAYLQRRGINEKTVTRFGIGFSCGEWDSLFKYLAGKGYNEESIAASGLVTKKRTGGYCDRFRDRIMFPIFDLRGNVIGFGGRVLDGSQPKYLNSPETIVFNKRKNLYGLNYAKNSGSKKLVVVEGYMDVISLHQSGIINAVATLGTALTQTQGRLLNKYAEEIIISFDSDTAGQAAAMRGIDILGDIGANVKVLTIPDGKDPDEYVRSHGPKAFERLLDSARTLLEYKIARLKEQTDTDSMEGKIEFLNGAADILAKVENSVEREMYVKKIADDYGITQESLYSEIYRRIRPEKRKKLNINAVNNESRGRDARENGQTAAEKENVQDERFILALLCVDNSLYKTVRDRISPDSFTDEENRRIAKIVFEKLGNNREITPGELLNNVEGETADDFSRIFNKECHCDDNKKAIMGKITSMELNKIKKRQLEILGLLKDESRLTEGDVEKLKQELRNLTLLIKERKSS